MTTGEKLPAQPARRSSRSIALAAILLWTLCAAASVGAADPQLVINELMYHPYESWPTNQPYPNTNLTEFVELYNAGTSTLALANYRFDAGISYTFTNGTLDAGSYLVLCQNLTAFTNAYPTVTNVFDTFSGTLNNGGERVRLSRLQLGSWVTEDAITYIDDDSSDGTGRSLELIHPKLARLDNQYYGDWFGSATMSGTPGRVNSTYTNAPLPVGGDVVQVPALPPAASAIKISARITGRDGDAVQSVVLEYRMDLNPQIAYSNALMGDTGLNGDVTAGDGVYTAYLPPVGSGLVMAAGEMLEYRINITDVTGTRTIPATNRAEATGTLSYLAKFGEDTQAAPGFPGEYDTYHMLMTKVNRKAFEERSVCIETPVDLTLVAPNGDLIFNCGLRLRGSGSRIGIIGNYRIGLPTGLKYKGLREFNLNHEAGLSQYMAMTIDTAAGRVASDVKLARVYLNESLKNPSQGIYCQLEGIDDDYLANHLPGAEGGNLYMGTGTDACRPTYGGDLTYFPSVSSYTSRYETKLNNPFTAWQDLQAMTFDLSQPTNTYPTVLTNRVNIPQWGLAFAADMCLDNQEAGYFCPPGSGDEVRMYLNPVTGKGEFFPWDYSNVLAGGLNNIWGFSHPVINKFLYNPPILPYYTGNLLGIITNVMSDANMNALFDKMGSKMTPSLRASTLSHVQSRRANILSNLSQNLTVNGLVPGTTVLLVPSTNAALLINLSGQAPQGFTDRVTVNGTNTSWNLRNNNWAMTNSIILPGDVADVVVRAVHPMGSILESLSFTAVAQRTPTSVAGTLASNTTWSSASGIYIVTSDVSVPGGVTLTVQPGTVLLFGAGRKLIVNGALDIRGTSGAPVYLYPQGSVAPWTIQATGAGSIASISNAVMTTGRLKVDSGATLNLYDSTLSGSQDTNGIIDADSAAFVHIGRCVVRDFNRTSFSASPTLIEESLLESMTAVGIEFSGTAATTTVSRTTLRNPLGTDGITFANSTAGLVTNALILGMSGTGVMSRTSTVTVVGSVIDACGTGISVDGASSVLTRNDTIVSSTVGIAGGPAITNVILWANATSLANGPAAAYSDIQIPGNGIYAGTGNLNRNPWFRSVADRDYQLLPISPCIGTGASGVNMGASHPTGANPVAPAGLALTASSNSIALTWQDLSTDEIGFEIYRSPDASAWTLLATVPAGTTSYTNAGLPQNTMVSYRVRAIHARGASYFTDAATATTTYQSMTALLIENLRITEIMYNPPGPDTNEFLEFKNISTNVLLDLSGCYTDEGRFVFTNGTTLAPQAFFVLVSNATAFAATYGVPIGGIYAMGAKELSNAGETLSLRDATGTDVIKFTYDDNGNGWYPTTDGNGYSLVPVEPNPFTGDPNNPLFWRASRSVGGSPGADDAEPVGSGMVINEVLAHTDLPLVDAIEVLNLSAAPINISGWYLSDNATNLTRYHIPELPPIPANGYHVFYETNSFNEFTNAPGAFRISEFGDEDVILSATQGGTNLTGYRSIAKFASAIEKSVSHGRYLRSDGIVDFVAMSSRSLGTINPAPQVGPIVINEIMYNPGEGGKEFIELLNIASSNIPLFDLSFPTNTWNFNGSMAFGFPINTTMAPGERVLVTSIGPVAFRQQFGIDAGIRIFGPFSGALANSGDAVKLYKPGPPEPITGFVPQILEDRVQYLDHAPWPALADNAGASLERRVPTAYGNDPTNWIAVSVGGTPGLANNTNGFPSVGFPDVSRSRVETNEVVAIGVTLLPAVSTTVTVSYAVSGGTATPGSDFTLAPGTLTFWPYETNKVINLAIINDSTPAGEPDETVLITLTNISANALLGGNRVFTHTIVDNDATNMPPPFIVPSVTTDFENFVQVIMVPSLPGSVIRYTTDGSLPTQGDTLYTQPFNLTTSARVTARTFLGSVNSGASTSVLFRAQAFVGAMMTASNTVRRSMVTSTDDGLEKIDTGGGGVRDGKIDFASTAITLGLYGTRAALFRFQYLPIPRSVTFTNAYLQFTSATNSSGTNTIRIYAQNADNPATLDTNRFSISSRPRTTNSVVWMPNPWNVSERGDDQRTPNLAAVLNEVISRPGWQPMNALAILIVWSNSVSSVPRHAVAFEGAPNNAALLHAEWVLPLLPTYYLTVVTNGHGVVSGGNAYAVEGSNVTITAQADPGSVFAGWSGDTDGQDTNSLLLTVVMNQDHTVTANFTTYYELTSSSAGGGTVGGSSNGFYAAGSLATVTVSAATGYRFAGWTGDVPAVDTNNAPLTLTMNQARAVVAHFALIPPPAPFSVMELSYTATNGFTLYWQSYAGTFYAVYRTTNLVLDWPGLTLESNIPASGTGTNFYTDTNTPDSASFYSVGAQNPE